jgi:hypothetical protein
MSPESRDFLAALAPAPGDACGPPSGEADAAGAVTAPYQAHALGLVRLAYVMLGNRASAEDVVQTEGLPQATSRPSGRLWDVSTEYSPARRPP